MTSKESLAKNLKNYRKEKGIAQEELAFKCALSPRHLSTIEIGSCNTTLDTLDKLSKGTGMTASDLLKQ